MHRLNSIDILRLIHSTVILSHPSLTQIDRAYIVVAHENGQEGNLVEMSGDELEVSYQSITE